MADPIQGGELIELVEIDQDLCGNIYGQNTPNELASPDNLSNVAVWTRVAIDDIRDEDGYESIDPDNTNEAHLLRQDVFVTAGQRYFFKLSARDDGIRYIGVVFPVALDNPTEKFLIVDLGTGLFESQGVDDAKSESAPDGFYTISGSFVAEVTGTYRFEIQLRGGFFQPVFDPNPGQRVDVKNSFFGQGAQPSFCTATLSADNPEKCFNTRVTCQDPANYVLGEPLRICCSKPNQRLPKNKQIIPVLERLDTNPSKLNTTSNTRNSPLGSRAKLTATLMDTVSIDSLFDPYYDDRLSGAARFDGIGYDPDERGTLWSKFRARSPYYLGREVRAIRGVLAPRGQLTEVDTRYYVAEKFDGPYSDGAIKIEAKDPLKLAENNRAQAPIASRGVLAADLNDTALTFDIVVPAGVDVNEAYPTPGTVCIGSEVVSYTRVGLTFTITNGRGEYNTEVSTHSADDTVQLCLVYFGDSAADIVYDLLVNYANINPDFINLPAWQTEADDNIPFAYGTVITKPEGVTTLVGELAEQAGFSIWWDEVNREIPFSVVKQPDLGSLTLSEQGDILEDTLKISDSPDVRISQVWVYFSQIDPTKGLDDNNFGVTLVTDDIAASGEFEYGQEEVRKIKSRWIGSGGLANAQSVADRLLSRFRDIPRKGEFTLPVHTAQEVRMGGAHTITSPYLVDEFGQPWEMNARILSAENMGAAVKYMFEELRFFAQLDGNLRPLSVVEDAPGGIFLPDLFEQTYAAAPQANQIVTVTVSSSKLIGQTTEGLYAFNVGDNSYWPVGITINIVVSEQAYVSGQGGRGGDGAIEVGGPPLNAYGGDGGDAFFTGVPVTVQLAGTIQSGGGGGGGSGITRIRAFTLSGSSSGGGGGAGYLAGPGGQRNNNQGEAGQAGSLVVGGLGGGQGDGLTAGNGGAPGQPGQNGEDGTVEDGGLGGQPGRAVVGNNLITWLDANGNPTTSSALQANGLIVGTVFA